MAAWARPAPPAPPRERTASQIARMIEGEIIPRLMLAQAALPEHGVDLRTGPAEAATDAVDAFTRLALSSDARVLTAHVERLVAGGLPLERVYVDLLAPAARQLGEEWVDDVTSFTDVTIGLSRLQQVVRGLAASSPAGGDGRETRAACFVTAPGEQHAFGLFLVQDRFHRAGWRTWLDTAATREDAAEAVACDWFDVLGLSATSDVRADDVAATIALARRRSLNPELFVMVGGRVFSGDAALVRAVGADATAETADDALSLADKAVRRPALA
jgi:methanogenic corrinoid protein MtbC1